MSVFCLRKRVAVAFFACSMLLPALSQAQVVTIISGQQKNKAIDGSVALNVLIPNINGMASNDAGDIFLSTENSVRKITANGILETICGGVTAGRTGDGGPAKQAKLSYPTGLALDKDGNLYVSDSRNACVRKIDTKGIITTVAGFGGLGYTDDTLAIHAKLNEPNALAVDDSGNLYIADTKNFMIRKVNASDGYIHTIAGSKTPLYASAIPVTGVPARDVRLNMVEGLTVLKNGDVIYSDRSVCILRKITPAGMMHTFAGDWKCNGSGDNAPATAVSLVNPQGITSDKNGNVYVTESVAGRVRKIDPSGLITTIAGGPGNRERSGKALEVVVAGEFLSVDVNGNVVISQTDDLIAFYAAKVAGDEEEMHVFPNPCQKFTNVVLPSLYAESATVHAIDASGRVVVTSTGTTNRNISLYFQDAGVYTILGVSKHGKWSGRVSVAMGE